MTHFHFIAPFWAMPFLQAAPSGGINPFVGLAPWIAIFAIFYFLLIRPQQKRAKELQTKIAGVQRGDTVVTTGGLIGKVTKVTDTELKVDVGNKVVVNVARNMLVDVRGKDATVANDRK